MSTNSIFRRSFNKQHGRRAQALLKSGIKHLDHLHWSWPGEWSWKKSLLLTCKFLRLLVNTLVADENYPVLNTDNSTIPIQMQVSQKQNPFSQFLAQFLNFRWKFEYFSKKHEHIGFSILEVTDTKNFAREISKKFNFRGPFNKQHRKRANSLLKSTSVNCYHIHYHIQLSWKKSLLLTCKFLGLLVNTLAADEKNPVLNIDNLTIPSQVQFSPKKKLFLNF